jgi:hypothetical protein
MKTIAIIAGLLLGIIASQADSSGPAVSTSTLARWTGTNNYLASRLGCKFGTNDDTAILRPLLNNTSGVPVRLLMDGLSTVTNLILNNCVIEGANINCGFKQADGVRDFFIYTWPTGDGRIINSNVYLKRLTLDGNIQNKADRFVATNSYFYSKITNAAGAELSGYSPVLNFGFMLANVDNVELDGIRFTNMASFQFTLLDAMNIRGSYLTFGHPISYTGGNLDAFHLFSCRDVNIKHVRVYNGSDDVIAVNTDEFTPAGLAYFNLVNTNGMLYWRGTNGNCSNIRFSDVVVYSTNRFGVRLLGYGSQNNATNLVLEDFTMSGPANGTSALHCQNDAGYGFGYSFHYQGLYIKNWNIEGNEFSGFNIYDAYGDDLVIDGFVTHSSPLTQVRPAYLTSWMPMSNVKLSNWRIYNTNSAVTNLSIIYSFNRGITNITFTDSIIDSPYVTYLLSSDYDDGGTFQVSGVNRKWALPYFATTNQVASRTLSGDSAVLPTGTLFYTGTYTTYPASGSPSLPGYPASYTSVYCANVSALTNDAVLYGRTNITVTCPVITTNAVTVAPNQQFVFGFYTNSAAGNGQYVLLSGTSNFTYTAAVSATNWFNMVFTFPVTKAIWRAIPPNSLIRFSTYNGSGTNLWMGQPTITVY